MSLSEFCQWLQRGWNEVFLSQALSWVLRNFIPCIFQPTVVHRKVFSLKWNHATIKMTMGVSKSWDFLYFMLVTGRISKLRTLFDSEPIQYWVFKPVMLSMQVCFSFHQNPKVGKCPLLEFCQCLLTSKQKNWSIPVTCNTINLVSWNFIWCNQAIGLISKCC
jgi:hypothetical protein